MAASAAGCAASARRSSRPRRCRWSSCRSKRDPRCASRGRRSRPASARSPARAQAAQAANEVLKITIVAFDAGSTTNIEVIDAQRSARDQELVVVQVEDAAAPGATGPARRARPVPEIAHRTRLSDARRVCLELLHREQLDFEDQRRVARNAGRLPWRSVPEVRRNDDAPYAADAHPLHALTEARQSRPVPTTNGTSCRHRTACLCCRRAVVL